MITIASGYPKGDKLRVDRSKGTGVRGACIYWFSSKDFGSEMGCEKEKRQERLIKIAQEAAEQSHRQIAPRVELLDTEKELFTQLSDYDVILVAYEESAKQGELANSWRKYSTL